ncbi:MAG: SAM-dependent methyltransferase [Proteobacteria bacterium]|nr:SAM-dependent methyltransferase [Pseudomonadota bacterium]MBU1714631.1 SAM-dependent methyltransferase [Pseudomonadota bacterium]
MSFTLAEVVPWGRSYDEYLAMFSLTPVDLQQKILGCSDGPASFNRVLSARGGAIISIDPIYYFTVEEIKKRIDETYEVVLAQTRKNKDEFIWENIASVEELGRIRMAAMTSFLEDYSQGKAQGRYRADSLPHLSFNDQEFGLALCSHFLLLYSAQLSLEFHLASIRELCRVAPEVRIFPLLELGAKKSRHLKSLVTKLEKEDYHIEIRKVAYQFQKGGNEMMIIKSATPTTDLQPE